jgi:hypothetical protein
MGGGWMNEWMMDDRWNMDEWQTDYGW